MLIISVALKHFADAGIVGIPLYLMAGGDNEGVSIAVTTVINMLRSARRRREFVYYCGVIGLCTPCTRAPSHTGRDPCWRGGLLALAHAAARERKPPSQQG